MNKQKFEIGQDVFCVMVDADATATVNTFRIDAVKRAQDGAFYYSSNEESFRYTWIPEYAIAETKENLEPIKGQVLSRAFTAQLQQAEEEKIYFEDELYKSKQRTEEVKEKLKALSTRIKDLEKKLDELEV